jgi:Beta-lactamase enzyme family
VLKLPGLAASRRLRAGGGGDYVEEPFASRCLSRRTSEHAVLSGTMASAYGNPSPSRDTASRRAAAIAVAIVAAGAAAAAVILFTSGSGSPHAVARASKRSSESASITYYHGPGSKLPPPATVDTRHSASGGSILKSGAAASFSSLASSMPAEIGVAVGPLGPGSIQKLGQLQRGHAWSSMKVPILVTLMREGKLSPEEQQWAAEALTASDNTAAANLFQELGRTHGGLSGASTAVQEVLETAGDTSTMVATAPPPPGAVSTWGQTEWSLTEAVQFYREMARGCLLSPAGTRYVRRLMGEVIPEQQWGLGQAGFPASWKVEMKGGWGPENGTGRYLVRQSGVVQDGTSGFAVTMIAKANSGSFEAGAQDLTQIASWLRENVRAPLPAIEPCS